MAVTHLLTPGMVHMIKGVVAVAMSDKSCNLLKWKVYWLPQKYFGPKRVKSTKNSIPEIT